MKTKTSYILKTINDLTFEFYQDELVTIVATITLPGLGERDMVADYKVQYLEKLDLPFSIMVGDDVKYTISHFSKVKMIRVDEFKGKRRISTDGQCDDHECG